MDKLLFCKVMATLMVLEPDSTMAKVVVEFAQRISSDDLEACWNDPATVEKLKQAWSELSEWEQENPGVINSMADAIDRYFGFGSSFDSGEGA